MTTTTEDIQQTAVNTIRTLSMDAVQAANSGHPGTPMALAPVAYSIFANKLNYDPADPNWFGRDRFVLSCGHASMLLYSMIHLSGIQKTDDNGTATGDPSITLDDIKNFRQMHRPTAGHPEYGYADGIETTTGPLGQGQATVLAWRSPPSGWLRLMIVLDTTYLALTPTRFAVMATSWKASVAKQLRWLAT